MSVVGGSGWSEICRVGGWGAGGSWRGEQMGVGRVELS